MSKDSMNATMENLQAKVDANQQAFVNTLQTITYELQPKRQLRYALEDLKYQATKLAYAAMDTVDEAREGDPDARQKVLEVGGAVVGVLLLLTIRRKIKNRRKRR